MGTPNEVPGGEMLVYQAADGSAQLDVRLEQGTVWPTLTALALLVAESLPANKDLLIRLLMNLLGGLGN